MIEFDEINVYIFEMIILVMWRKNSNMKKRHKVDVIISCTAQEMLRGLKLRRGFAGIYFVITLS